MTAEIVERVLRSSRYRDVDRSLLARFAAEELPRARNTDEAVKRVKRRLHQAVGAVRGAGGPFRLDGSTGALTDPALRSACADAMGGHASTRERLPYLDTFYSSIWAITGIPQRVMDLGCGLNPLALPWMGLGDATYLASDVDRRPLETVRQFLELAGQPHRVEVRDLVSAPPTDAADVALLLKLIPTLDRQDAGAATRLLDELRVPDAVISFPRRSLGGRAKGQERTYRERIEGLVADSTRVRGVVEASVPNELVFVVTLDG